VQYIHFVGSLPCSADCLLLFSTCIAQAANEKSGRRVRFHLPGSSSSVDLAAVASAEHDEDSRTGQNKSNSHTGRHKRVKISVESNPIGISARQSSNLTSNLSQPSTSGSRSTAVATRIGNDPESWINRIMQGLDSPLCCREYWESHGNSHDKAVIAADESFYDHSTIATNSFETFGSTIEVSSVTPILPPIATSSSDDNNNEDEKESEREADGAILGIQSLSHGDDVFVLEESAVINKQAREQKPSPCDYGREQVASRGKDSKPPESLSNWRKKAWATTSRGKRKRNNSMSDASEGVCSLEDEFDLESNSEYGVTDLTGNRPGRLVEI